MSPASVKKEPTAKGRRRAIQARQLVIYTLLAAVLAIAALYAAAIVTGRTPAPFSRGFTSPSPEVFRLPDPPCPSSPDARPVQPDQITVNVLNGTSKSGLAGQVSGQLVERGFVAGTVGNSPSSYAYVAEIRTGAASVDAAYTVAAQMQGASIVVDSRTTPDIDVVVGDQFKALLDTDSVDLNYDVPIKAPSNCVVAAATPDTESTQEGGDGAGDGTDTGEGTDAGDEAADGDAAAG